MKNTAKLPSRNVTKKSENVYQSVFHRVELISMVFSLKKVEIFESLDIMIHEAV